MNIDQIHAMLIALMHPGERTVGVEEVMFLLSQSPDWKPLAEQVPFCGKTPQVELLELGLLFQTMLLVSADLSWAIQIPLPGENPLQHQQHLEELWGQFARKANQFVLSYGEKRLHDFLCASGKPDMRKAIRSDFDCAG